jgi:hypothetical protein
LGQSDGTIKLLHIFCSLIHSITSVLLSFQSHRLALPHLSLRENIQHLGFFCRLASVADTEFPINILQVFFYCIRRNEQPGGNFSGRQPLHQKVQDLEFAARQGLDQGLGGVEGGMGN